MPTKISVIEGDITTLEVDAIVNAANTRGYRLPTSWVIHTVGQSSSPVPPLLARMRRHR